MEHTDERKTKRTRERNIFSVGYERKMSIFSQRHRTPRFSRDYNNVYLQKDFSTEKNKFSRYKYRVMRCNVNCNICTIIF